MLDPSRLPKNPAIPSDPNPPQPRDARTPEGTPEPSPCQKFLDRTAADDDPANIPPPLSEDFRHSGWAPFRRKVEQALLTTEGVTPRRIGAFRLCGCNAFVEGRTINPMLPSIKEFRIKQTKCHDRFCVPCSQERASRVRHSLLNHMKDMVDLKLITLTLRNMPVTLTEALDRITRCFRLLRNKPLWKKKITGGVWIIETKIGEKSGEWHCHIHCVAQGKFFPQNLLSQLWHAITGDSKIVDIRPVGAKRGAVSYITKYVTKAADTSIVNDPERLRQAITAFNGRRLISTFGSWRGLELMEKPNDDTDYYYDADAKASFPKGQWQSVGTLDEILRLSTAGDPFAQYVVRKLRRNPRPPPTVPV